MARQRAVRTGLVVWAVLLALYVGLISGTTWVELAVGAAAAAAAAAVGGLAARFLHVALAVPRLRWRWLWTFPYDTGLDVVRLSARLVGITRSQRERHGWWDEIQLPDDAGASASTRAYAVLVVSLTPASYVTRVDVDHDGHEPESAGTLRVHRWARKGPVERVVSP